MLRLYPELRAHPAYIGVPQKMAEEWCAVIEETMAEQPERRRLVELRYFEGLTEEEVRKRLPLGRTCYIKWRAELLYTIAAKAAYRRILAP